MKCPTALRRHASPLPFLHLPSDGSGRLLALLHKNV
ncbi:hypothetical protein SLEP1_g52649 [Rubroshorea leprosula]|uniref:Uncharacterized protein n=1 Tax=Rubroshorea leprosula TaxID=152421 RepID=A0AAV5M7V5_9ROSI|nr:hypothetical protein SLEP1_g52649 [Rubroshorea leprosula]